MQGHIRKYKDRYAGVIYLGKDSQGKKEYKWFYDKDKKVCEKKVNEFIYKFNKGQYIKPSKTTLEEYAKDWLEYRQEVDKLAEETIKTYKSAMLHFSPLWNKEMCKITVKDIEQHYLYLIDNEVSVSNVNKVHTLLYSIFKSAYKKQEVEKNILDFVSPPRKTEEFEPAIIENDVFIKTLEVSRGTYLEMIVILCGGLGLRVAEALGVQKSNIDFENGFLYVRQQLRINKGKLTLLSRLKTKSSKRDVAIPPDFGNFIKLYIDEQEKRIKDFERYTGQKYNYNDMLICKDDGSYMSPRNVERHWRKLLKDNNIPHYRIHDLRHFNAILMLENNLPDKFAKEQLGHSSLKMTDRYQHIRKKFAQKIISKISFETLKN